MRAQILLVAAFAAVSCGTDPPAGPTSLVPSDYATRFVEVRRCRGTVEHQPNPSGDVVRNIRVWINPESAQAYINNAATLPAGTVVVKEEFGGSCNAADLLAWTVMRKEPGFDPPRGDWHWQRVRAGAGVSEDGRVNRCISCHDTAACRARDWQCTERQAGDP
ncbi:MAG: cytochrome P460 family protein [Polyangiales bacterium]